MVIVYVEGVEEVWRHGYVHGDALSKNVIIRFAKCKLVKKSAKFDIIDKKCIIWNKEYLVFVDPSFMKLREGPSSDLVEAVKPWEIFEKEVQSRFPLTEGTKMNKLIQKINKIIKLVSRSIDLSPITAYELCNVVLRELKAVQDEDTGSFTFKKRRKRKAVNKENLPASMNSAILDL